MSNTYTHTQNKKRVNKKMKKTTHSLRKKELKHMFVPEME